MLLLSLQAHTDDGESEEVGSGVKLCWALTVDDLFVP